MANQSGFSAFGGQIVNIMRRLGSLLPRGNRGRSNASARRRVAQSRRVIRPWRDDALRSYPTAGLLPSTMRAMLQQADGGDPERQFDFFAEMLQKWPRLAAVEATRRLALTGLEWEITPSLPARGDATVGRGDFAAKIGEASAARPAAAASFVERETMAVARGVDLSPRANMSAAGLIASPEAAADFCRETLAAIDDFRGVLDQLARAIGFGIAVAELVWERGRLIDIVPVPHSRLKADPHEPWRIRVRTEGEPTVGVAIDEQPGKWIVHDTQATPGRTFDGGLLRATALLFMAQNITFKDWLTYTEIAGIPLRVGRYQPHTSDEERQQLLDVIQAIGRDAATVVSKEMDIDFIDLSRNSERTYQAVQEYCNTEVTILWLGQRLTTDIGNNGSRAAAEVHDRVREDLLVSDIAAEARTLRRDVLTPLVRAKFGAGVAVPQFRRSLVQAQDTEKLAATLSVAVNELRMTPPREWMYQALGIPEPRAGEAVVGGDVAK